MIQSFRGLSSGSSESTEEIVSEGIKVTLITTQIGVLVGLVGIVLLCIALFAQKYRANWFFRSLVIYSVLSLIVFPIGTVIGIVFLVYVFTRKEEFIST